ncbi:MAG: PA2779 family protein [Idiomarina sp.]|nr:PA2779 family protein [Idiomarina sp.]
MSKVSAIGFSVLVGSLAFATSYSPVTQADIVSTHEIVHEARTGFDRAQLTEQLQRQDVREQLIQFGVNPDEAVMRVAAMTDAEVRELTAGIDQLPARV